MYVHKNIHSLGQEAKKLLNYRMSCNSQIESQFLVQWMHSSYSTFIKYAERKDSTKTPPPAKEGLLYGAFEFLAGMDVVDSVVQLVS